MHFTELFIRRPVMTTLVMLAILLFGVMSYRLPAGERSAQRGFSHHPGDRQSPRGQPRDHGLVGGHPPGDASSPPSPAWTP